MDKQMMTSPEKSKKKMWIAIASAVAAVVAITVGVILTIALSKPTINLNDYVSVSFSSYDGYGTASMKLDYKKLEKDFEEELRTSCPNLEKVLFYYDSVSKYICKECVDVELSNDRALSNGDVVILKWNANKEKLEEVFGCNFEFSDKKYTVSGLSEIVKVDAFKDIEITFEGVSGEAKATVVNNANGSPMEKMRYRIDPSYNLSNGDVITVYLDTYFSIEDDVNSFMNEYGAVPMADSKTFTVENLPAYVTDADQITDDYILSCKPYIENQIKNDIIETNANQVGMNVTIDSTDYAGYYFVKTTAVNNYEPQNALYILYKVNVTIDIPELSFNGTREFYSAVYIKNIAVRKDGQVVGDTSNIKVVSDSCYEIFRESIFSKSFTFMAHGFSSMERFCDEIKNDYRENKYTHWDKLVK